MTSIGDVSPKIKRESDESTSTLNGLVDSQSSSTNEMSKCSGLSALIDAATVRLVEVQETENCRPCSHDPHNISSEKFIHGQNQIQIEPSLSQVASGASAKATTPPMLPETHDSQDQSFLQVLMTLLTDPENSNTITFLPDGKFFAIRSNEFATDLMRRSFFTENYSEFLQQLFQWGFSRIETERAGIQIFRHPHFRRDHRDLYANMISPSSSPTTTTHEQASAVPTMSHIQLGQHSTKKDSRNKNSKENDDTPSEATKRQLSPAHSQRDISLTKSSQKLRLDNSDGEKEGNTTAVLSSNSTMNLSEEHARRRQSNERRDLALSLTSERLNLHDDSQKDQAIPLMEQAVESATHSIVADAIESLLRDEDHSRETYRKHEQALTKSALPGVEPITKQLFSSTRTDPNGNFCSLETQRTTSNPPLAKAAPPDPKGSTGNHIG